MATLCSTAPPIPRVIPDLSAIRTAKGVSLQQISEATKIRVHYLKAIEALKFAELPGGVFATSYIRQYARAIEFDEWELLATYDSTLPAEDVEPQRSTSGWADTLRLTVLRIFAPSASK